MIEQYKPSGKFTPLFPLYLIGGFAVIIGLAWIYIRLLDWIPFIYISFLLTAAFGFAAGFLLVLAVERGKCRNVPLAILAGLLIGAGAIGAKHWMQYKYTVAAITKHMATESGEAEIPVDVASQIYTFPTYIDDRVTNGWSMGSGGSDGDISGIFVWGVWLLEALVVLACCVSLPRGKAKEPFSESCGKWADEEEPLMAIPVAENVPMYAGASSYEDLLDFPEPTSGPTGRSLVYMLNSVPGEDLEDSYLTITDHRVTVNKKGEESVKDTKLFSYVPVSMENREDLIARIDEFAERVNRERSGA